MLLRHRNTYGTMRTSMRKVFAKVDIIQTDVFESSWTTIRGSEIGTKGRIYED